MSFEFQTAGRIIFGAGRVQQLHELAKGLGTRALLITGRSSARSDLAEQQLSDAGVSYEVVRTSGEPSIEQARQASELGRATRVEFVLAFGGGSALDLGKAVAALIPAAGDALDYLEVIGRGKSLETPALPVLAVPTTAGTGAEVTKNAVLSSAEERVKVSLRHESMLPRVALVDPALTLGSPPALTAATGLDALTQCLEPLVSCQHNPLTDAVALEGLRRGARALACAYEHGEDIEARTDMALCSLFGGLALANAKLGAVHGLAAPLGGMLDSPHGAVCARLLPFVFEVNLRALRLRRPGSPLLARFDQVACVLTGKSAATADDAVGWLRDLAGQLRVPGLGSYGLTSGAIEDVAQKAGRASSMKGNPLPLEHEELVEILERSL